MLYCFKHLNMKHKINLGIKFFIYLNEEPMNIINDGQSLNIFIYINKYSDKFGLKFEIITDDYKELFIQILVKLIKIVIMYLNDKAIDNKLIARYVYIMKVYVRFSSSGCKKRFNQCKTRFITNQVFINILFSLFSKRFL